MMRNGNDNNNDRPMADSQVRTWADLEQLARQVIHASNVAVMIHAELDLLDDTDVSENRSGKKAG
ncbi:MAG: hypothetical protein GX629_01695 [Phycisphaerae bacterium]|jgi:hypothetical protein|nr:hypothetical protein [Phycisphaerae bacterium]